MRCKLSRPEMIVKLVVLLVKILAGNTLLPIRF